MLLLRCPLVVLSRQLVLAYPLVILSLRRPLILSSRRLVVVLPLVAPPTHVIVAPPSHPLFEPADCCIASCCCATLSTSHRAGWLLCCLSLLRPLVLSLCRPLASTEYQLNLCRLVVASPLVTPPSCLSSHRTASCHAAHYGQSHPIGKQVSSSASASARSPQRLDSP